MADQLADLANVEWIIVSLGLGLGMYCVGVLPGLARWSLAFSKSGTRWPQVPYLRESAIVPKIALVGEAVADIAKLALLDVLFDGVQELILGDLESDRWLFSES